MKKNNAVSEIIGTILLLAIAVSAFAVIYLQFTSDNGPTPETYVNIYGDIIKENIILTHRGGESLDGDDPITFTIAGKTISYNISKYLIDSNNNKKWDFNEVVKFNFLYESNISYDDFLDNIDKYEYLNIQATDSFSNAIEFRGPIYSKYRSEIGLYANVSNNKPSQGDIVSIYVTLFCYGGDVPAAGNVSINCSLPAGLEFLNYTSDQGLYDNKTGIWHLGNIRVDRSPYKLNITARVYVAYQETPTKLVCILDGSESILDTNWDTFTRGLSDAIKSSLPHSGSVELTVIQFGGNKGTNPNAKIEKGPIIVNSSNYQSIADSIWKSNSNHITQMKSYTPLSCGIRRANDFLKFSANYNDYKHIICLITDGNPNCKGYIYPMGDSRRYKIDTYGTSDSDYSTGRTDAEVARNETINNVIISNDELDILVINGSQQWGGPSFPNLLNWLKNNITWPGNYLWSEEQEEPLGSGWVREVKGWDEFPSAIKKMFNAIFGNVNNTVEIIHSTTIDFVMENNKVSFEIKPYI